MGGKSPQSQPSPVLYDIYDGGKKNKKNPHKNHKRFVTKLEGWWNVSLAKGFKFFLFQTCVLHLDLFPTLPPQLYQGCGELQRPVGCLPETLERGWRLATPPFEREDFPPQMKGNYKVPFIWCGKHQRFGSVWVTEGFSGKVYPSSHSHGSGKWVPAKLVSFDLG